MLLLALLVVGGSAGTGPVLFIFTLLWGASFLGVLSGTSGLIMLLVPLTCLLDTNAVSSGTSCIYHSTGRA